MALNALLFGKASLVLVLNEGSFMTLSSIDLNILETSGFMCICCSM